MSFMEIFQPGLKYLREERDRRRMDVAYPTNGGNPPIDIDLDAGTATILVPVPAPEPGEVPDPEPGEESAPEPGEESADEPGPSPVITSPGGSNATSGQDARH
jgi:hypothetical protein